MRKVMRASKIFPGDSATLPYRIVLAYGHGNVCPFVVWTQCYEGGRSYFASGNYHYPDQAAEASKAFTDRLAMNRLAEDYDFEISHQAMLKRSAEKVG